MVLEICWETPWIVTVRQRDSKSGPTSEREKWPFWMRGVQTKAGHYLMSKSSVYAQVSLFLFQNKIRISLIYRIIISLNLTLVIYFPPKNIERFKCLFLIFKVVALNKRTTRSLMEPSKSIFRIVKKYMFRLSE